ncbi:MAG: glycerate kinase [Succinivibrio dextrinosolvens]|uniref:glycerate kinase family protein n=1 Tax=uncultured Succinivibrio sp. TaxID=540749 RepID=UPI0025D1879E|nr:glycerate kinase [uncultured Succinivibrio sp.]MDY6419103.1 glycerate kinase [Succinivibrio dextrinosolvens]MDY6469956.1 glycerate kinase [Succinivibrio dextrinosolvens]
MKVVLAPDSFKGSLTSSQAASAMERGIRKVLKDAQIEKVWIADGGEGTVEAIVSMTGGQYVHTKVEGPLGEKVDAVWGLCTTENGKTAVIEMAAASGILITPQEKRNVKKASTFGTGQLIKAALDSGASCIIIGIGGSATNDGGAGMAQALGAQFYDSEGKILPKGGEALSKLHSIDLRNLDPRLNYTKILIASDVKNPLCGSHGCSAVYGPQKGATAKDVEILDKALENYAAIARRDVGIDIRNVPGAGAAGGLGAGLMLFANGKMEPGIELILNIIGFENIAKDADLVFTGEGFTDSQTANGKAPVGVAAIAKKYKIPVICLSGGISSDASALYNHGIDAVSGTPCAPISLNSCIENAATMLEDAAERIIRLVLIGTKLNRK